MEFICKIIARELVDLTGFTLIHFIYSSCDFTLNILPTQIACIFNTLYTLITSPHFHFTTQTKKQRKTPPHQAPFPSQPDTIRRLPSSPIASTQAASLCARVCVCVCKCAWLPFFVRTIHPALQRHFKPTREIPARSD